MNKTRLLGLLLAFAFSGVAQPVLLQVGARSLALTFPSPIWPEWQGLLAQDVPARGLALAPIVQALGGLPKDVMLTVFSQDREAVATVAAEEISSAVLVFLGPSGGLPEAPLLLVAGELRAARVRWLWGGSPGEALPEVGEWPEKATLTLVTPEGERAFSLAELETSFVAHTYPGSYIRSSGERVTALWTGVPLPELLGNWPADTEVEVVAADGYRMRYRYDSLMDPEGMWILAFKQDGKYLPFNPGYFRLVKAGPANPTFPSAASARMVTRIEVRGQYRPYALKLVGAREHVFSRWDLELGVACPCRARTVTVTQRGQTRTYTGLPLWRLLAYVDDEVFPQGAGIKFDDAAFNADLAREGYVVEIHAADGFVQVIPSAYLAREDRFILALKVDGRFLSEEEGGPLLFVWDEGISAPPGLKRVKWVTEIRIRSKE